MSWQSVAVVSMSQTAAADEPLQPDDDDDEFDEHPRRNSTARARQSGDRIQAIAASYQETCHAWYQAAVKQSRFVGFSWAIGCLLLLDCEPPRPGAPASAPAPSIALPVSAETTTAAAAPPPLSASAPASAAPPVPSARSSSEPPHDPAGDEWEARCVVEMSKGRDEAARIAPKLAQNSVVRNRTASGARVVFLEGDDIGPQATFGPPTDEKRLPAWVDVVSAHGHSMGHWFWRRTYDGGEGSVTLDHDAPPAMHRAIEVMKRAIDRCFSTSSPPAGR